MGSRWRDAELVGRLGLAVIASGVALCALGTVLEPRSRPDVEYAWWAQLLACVFWAGACAAAAGVLRRRRVALLGALASAMSFTVAAATVPFVTPQGVTLAWFGEIVCALAFVAIVGRAIGLSRAGALSSRVREPLRAPLRHRARA